jgi:hypothetical protein
MNLPAVADLLDARGLRLLPGSFAVPVNLLVELPDTSVARFTASGTTIRLSVYEPGVLTSIVVPTECGCGQHHEPSGPRRTVVDSHATPTVERTIDGTLEYGWRNHEAGLLRLPQAIPYFFDLLASATAPTPVLVGAS